MVCQAKMFSQVLDPDFNYVSYQWKWKRNGTAVRTITHGGLMDVLASGIGAVGDVQP